MTKMKQNYCKSRRFNARFNWYKLGSLFLLGSCLALKIAFHIDPIELLMQTHSVKESNSNSNPNTAMNKNVTLRSILKHFVAGQQQEGVGATVRRSIGSMQMRKFSPFLMLDHFTVSPPAGFPDHPHHGQETITYVLGGMIAHEDFSGAKGILSPGDLQFMTAGKAIVHSEIPVKMDNGDPAVGLQLWVDLPQEMKDCEPRYRDLRSKDTPVVKPNENLEVRVISGKAYGVDSVRDLAYTPVHLYHYVTSKKGTSFVQEFPRGFNVFMYVMKGSVTIGDEVFPPFSTVFFNDDGDAIAGASASKDAEFALVGGQILNQEVIQHGPFVESNRDRLLEVFQNYQYSVNGFERARNWRSSIADGISEKEAKKVLQ